MWRDNAKSTHHHRLVLIVELDHEVPKQRGLGHQLGLVPPPDLLHARLLQRDQGVVLQVVCTHADADLITRGIECKGGWAKIDSPGSPFL